MEYCYFLKEDLEILDSKILEIKAEIGKAQEEKSLATTQSSETWHDNFGFEEGVRQIKQLSHRLMELAEIRSKAKLAPLPDNGKTGIGSIITIKDETRKESRIKIGSYLMFEGNAISYVSSMGKLLMNSSAGETKEGLIGNKLRTISIIGIE